MNRTVQAERERRGWSIRDAAREGGISNTTWSRFEESGRVTPAVRKAVAQAFTWPLGWPDGETEQPGHSWQPHDPGDLVAAVRQAIVDGEERSAKMDEVVRTAGDAARALSALTAELRASMAEIDEIAEFVRRREAALSRRPGELDP